MVTAKVEERKGRDSQAAEEACAEWLSDPSSLALPPKVASDSSSLLLLNAICPAVHFQRTAHVQIEVVRPFLTVPVAASDRSTSPTQPSAVHPASSAVPPRPIPSAPPKKDVTAGAVLSLMSSLLSHAHSLSSDAKCAGSEVKAGTVVTVDDAQWLDSASEELLLSLSSQLPTIRFIFAGVHSGREEEKEEERGTSKAAAAGSQSLRKRLTAIAESVAVSPTSPSLQSFPPPTAAQSSSPLPTSSAPAVSVPSAATAKKAVLHLTHLVLLHRLSSSDLSLMVQAELDSDHVDPSVTSFLLERSGGIPSFALEMLRALRQGKLLHLTTEAETAIDEEGRVRGHVLSSRHLEQAREQSQLMQPQNSRSSSGTGAILSSLPSTPTARSAAMTPVQLQRGLSESSSTAPSGAGTPIKMYRVCSFASHWQEDATLSSLPSSMDEMLASRFDACSPDSQLLLRMAAVFGRSIDLRCMTRLWEHYSGRTKGERSSLSSQHRGVFSASARSVSTMAVEELCRSLLSAGLLVKADLDESSSASTSYSFAQSSMQDMIYHRMPFSLRCRLHLSHHYVVRVGVQRS